LSKHIIEGFILGDSVFANWVKETFLSVKQEGKEIPQLKKLKPKVSTETVKQWCRQSAGSLTVLSIRLCVLVLIK